MSHTRSYYHSDQGYRSRCHTRRCHCRQNTWGCSLPDQQQQKSDRSVMYEWRLHSLPLSTQRQASIHPQIWVSLTFQESVKTTSEGLEWNKYMKCFSSSYSWWESLEMSYSPKQDSRLLPCFIWEIATTKCLIFKQDSQCCIICILMSALSHTKWRTWTTAGAPSRGWPVVHSGGGTSLQCYTPAGVTGSNEWIVPRKFPAWNTGSFFFRGEQVAKKCSYLCV